jgi:hypothetical protein
VVFDQMASLLPKLARGDVLNQSDTDLQNFSSYKGGAGDLQRHHQ